MLLEFGIWCGGIIYSRSVVLTAAHCFYERRTKRIPVDQFVFAFGKEDLTKREEGTEALSVASSLKLHEGFTPESGYNDIAIVRLDQPLCFTKWIQPLRIGDPNREDFGTDIPLNLQSC
jgi:secreted trypsin-like serine protease